MLAPFFWFIVLLGAARDLQSRAFILESPGFTRGYNCFAPPELGNYASRLRCFILEQGLYYHIQSLCGLCVFARVIFFSIYNKFNPPGRVVWHRWGNSYSLGLPTSGR